MSNRAIGGIAGGVGALSGSLSSLALRRLFWSWYTHSIATMLCFPLIGVCVGGIVGGTLGWVMRRPRIRRQNAAAANVA
jgi:hypothetical protein